MKRFIDFVGNASTTASVNGRIIGRNVSVARYDVGSGNYLLVLESNGRRARGSQDVVMSHTEYDDFIHETGAPLFARAIARCGGETDFY